MGLLKRVCRQRTQGAWKEWRSSMEQHRASWLANHLHLLHQDQAFLQSGLERVQQVHHQAQQLQTGLRESMAAQRNQHLVCCFSHLALLQLLLVVAAKAEVVVIQVASCRASHSGLSRDA